MFQTVLRERYVDGTRESDQYAYFECWIEIELPFAPMSGLCVQLEEGSWVEINRVTWVQSNTTFECWCGEHYQDVIGNNLEHKRAYLTDAGWSVSKTVNVR